eukprot:Tbor_TRINITY_DN5186_c0_g1::TRINITY_DN5186_c0_g1_i1::g.25870::m.25870
MSFSKKRSFSSTSKPGTPRDGMGSTSGHNSFYGAGISDGLGGEMGKKHDGTYSSRISAAIGNNGGVQYRPTLGHSRLTTFRIDENNIPLSIQVLHENIKAQAIELEMEKNQRESSIRELSTRTHTEISEMKEIIKQLRIENSTMKESLWTVERKVKSLQHQGTSSCTDHTSNASTGFLSPRRESGHHSLPLIPRVRELETDVTWIKSYIDELKVSERSRDEFQAKYHSDYVSLKESLATNCREMLDREIDRHNMEQKRVHDDYQRTIFSINDNTINEMSRLESELKKSILEVEKKANDALQYSKATTAGGEAIELQFNNIRAEIKVNQAADHRVNEEALINIRSDVNKALREHTKETQDAQQDMQSYVSQKIELANTNYVTRDEYTRFQQQTISSLSMDVESANRLAQSAKVTAEDVRREHSSRISKYEADQESLKATVDGLVESKSSTEQQHRKVAGELDEFRGRFKTLHSLSEEFQERSTQQAGKIQEVQSGLETVVSAAARLKTSVETAANIDVQDKQHLKERMYVLEELTQDTVRKARMMEDTLRADIDRAYKTATEAAEVCRNSSSTAELHGDDVASTKKTNQAIDVLQKKLMELQNRCNEIDTTLESLRDDTTVIVNSKLDAFSKKINGKIDEGLKDCHNMVEGNDEQIKAAFTKLEEHISSKDKAATATIQGVRQDIQDKIEAIEEEVKARYNDLAQKQKKDMSTVNAEITEVTYSLRDLDQKLSQQVFETANLGKQIQQEAAEKTEIRAQMAEEKRAKSEEKKNDAEASARQNEAITIINKKVITIEALMEGRLAETSMEEMCLKVTNDVIATYKKENHASSEKNAQCEQMKIQEMEMKQNSKLQSIAEDISHLHAIVEDLAALIESNTVNAEDTSKAIVHQNTLLQAVEESLNVINMEIGDSLQVAKEFHQNYYFEKGDAQRDPDTLGAVIQMILAHYSAIRSDFEEESKTISSSVMEITRIVDRHEVGFASMNELVEAIEFNASNIVTLADAVGLDKEGYRLQVFNDSELQGVISEAAVTATAIASKGIM